jgi:hypothetical protein
MTPVQVIRLVIPTIIYYAVSLTAILFLHKLSPGGPCVPGFGVLAAFVVFWTTIALLARNYYLAISGNKKHYLVAIIHTLVLGTCMVMIINN